MVTQGYGESTPRPWAPKEIVGIADLARPGVRLSNKEKGSSSRVYLDSMFAQLGISPSIIDGYADESATELGMASRIA
ncbi:MAG: substrate-binding domain-containing protein, partial [Coriobacteriaceae bacterium]|nr:substrate-binding domain-containing protein [Coriobacteriaceae bacterium]